MTFSSALKPFALVITGVALGWWSHEFSFFGNNSVVRYNSDARLLKVKDVHYSVNQLPIEHQLRIHSAYMQSQFAIKSVAEEFAAQIVASQGKRPDDFSWDTYVQAAASDKEIEKTYNYALGFKEKGPLTDPKVRAEVVKFILQRDKPARIGDEISKLQLKNELKVYLNYSPAPKLQQDFSLYPVIEVGNEGDVLSQEIQVAFSYAFQSGENVFYALANQAETLKRRLKIRFLFESTALPKELAAIGVVNCLAQQQEGKRDAWVAHLRFMQQMSTLPDNTSELPFEQWFPGDLELVKRLKSCPPKSIDEKVIEKNSVMLKRIRNNDFPMLFIEGQKISELDPRGFFGTLTELAVKR